jgi:two-component system, chemotaxis family, sensor kinase CheA
VVTAVSGRGVGMGVVKTNIEKIGGTIELKSAAGAGTTFIIKIPLTLAIVSALIVAAGGERFAIPQISVVELVRAQNQASLGHNSAATSEPVIERINDTPVLRLRDRLLPLINLNDLLSLGTSRGGDSGSYIVVAQVGASLLGIMVDRVFDTEEIVVKPVAPILRHVTMFSGNTILGDGSVIMILDPNGIARATGIGSGSGASKAVSANASDPVRSNDLTAMLLFRAGSNPRMAVPLGLVARLEDIPRDKIEISCGSPVTQYRGKLMPLVALTEVVDDSRVVRKVARRILEAHGFEVAEAGDGQQALDSCRARMPDCVLLDWNMPVMNGLDFLKRLRAEYGPDKPPVVFCTTETDMSAIEQAIVNGAQEYIMKPFDEEILVGKFQQVGLL